jgi:hypothetical protein
MGEPLNILEPFIAVANSEILILIMNVMTNLHYHI